jgi:hypothetical protein
MVSLEVFTFPQYSNDMLEQIFKNKILIEEFNVILVGLKDLIFNLF